MHHWTQNRSQFTHFSQLSLFTIDELNATHPSIPQSRAKQRCITRATAPTKLELCLRALLDNGERGIWALASSVSAYGETCLPTTMSQLIRWTELPIQKNPHPHRHRHGGRTTFTRYALPHREAAECAIEHLNALRMARGAVPLTVNQSRALERQFARMC